MTADRLSGPLEIHIPDMRGRPICGRIGGRTSQFASPTCPECRARRWPSGMEPEDYVNPLHPVGRIVVGSVLGVPGFPRIPGLSDKPDGG
jgi:hypothetical protein